MLYYHGYFDDNNVKNVKNTSSALYLLSQKMSYCVLYGDKCVWRVFRLRLISNSLMIKRFLFLSDQPTLLTIVINSEYIDNNRRMWTLCLDFVYDKYANDRTSSNINKHITHMDQTFSRIYRTIVIIVRTLTSLEG